LRPHGIKGAVRVEPWLDDLDVYGRIEEVFSRDEPARKFGVAACHKGGKGAIVWRFTGIDTPEGAEALRGTIFLADRKFLDGPDDGVLYFEDFEGCEVIDEAGSPLGRVMDMFGAGGNDVIVIRTPGGEELLVPATREAVLRREGDRWIFRIPRFDDED
ncbi:MAG: ribosome maturation factor RimM, partial [Nitrospinae bacterium]|nr:ribosome maturation factor RimM [Nitrospinota bacterium]